MGELLEHRGVEASKAGRREVAHEGFARRCVHFEELDAKPGGVRRVVEVNDVSDAAPDGQGRVRELEVEPELDGLFEEKGALDEGPAEPEVSRLEEGLELELSLVVRDEETKGEPGLEPLIASFLIVQASPRA